MQLGLDRFIAIQPDPVTGIPPHPADRMRDLLAEVTTADAAGLDAFGIGEHHRHDFLDSTPAVILPTAAARTQPLRLTSAVTVLSAHDPVRVFQDFATLVLISGGRAEIVAGRGSFTEAFPLFGHNLKDYDTLFTEKLDLLLKLRAAPAVHWSGQHRTALTGQSVFPRPLQSKIPIWIGVGGTPKSFRRAGTLGLPLMVAIIGGEPRQFRPLHQRPPRSQPTRRPRPHPTQSRSPPARLRRRPHPTSRRRILPRLRPRFHQDRPRTRLANRHP